MGRSKVYGTCHICSAEGKLSFEHVPPRKAYNDHGVVWTTLDRWVERQAPDWQGQEGRKQQKGSGGYTLCERCNNSTGDWYAREYIAWAKAGIDLASQLPVGQISEMVLRQSRPCNFLKQVVAMLLSVNPPPFADLHPELVQFVKSRRSYGILSPKYDFFLTVVSGCNARFNAVSSIGDFFTGKWQLLSEVAYAPFSVVMTINTGNEPLEREVGRISHFSHFRYDEVRDVRLRVGRGHITTPYSGDFRSLDAVKSQMSAA